MTTHPDVLPVSSIEALVEAVGAALPVTYAPPNIFPMSNPHFDAAARRERPAPPAGPLGVYVHVPYCNYKCTFCFYATRSVTDDTEMSRYLDAIERELSWIPKGTRLQQLYVGGGTPTALPPGHLDRLLSTVFARATGDEHVHTVECSPESLTEAHADVIRARGIARVSMGVQTNDAQVLATTHRRHDAAQVERACEVLLAQGLMVNVDLIYGLPGQTEESFEADLRWIASRGVHSVTTYNLRLNESTPIGRLVAPEERADTVRLVRWRETASRVARDLGFVQTRWHTFQREEPATARDTARRFRDVTGWGPQLGAGPSARSRLFDAVYRNVKDHGTYLARIEGGLSPVDEVRPLEEGDRRLRFVALTIGDGLPLDRAAYQRTFSRRVDDDFGATISKLTASGVIEDRGADLVLTPAGRLVYDLALRAFYPEPARRWIEDRQRLTQTSKNLRPAGAR